MPQLAAFRSSLGRATVVPLFPGAARPFITQTLKARGTSHLPGRLRCRSRRAKLPRSPLMMCRTSGGPQLIAKTRSELAIDQIQVVPCREPSLTAAAISNSGSLEVGAGKNDGVSKGASPAASALTHACRPALVLVQIAALREPRALRWHLLRRRAGPGMGDRR